jgi:hypothetical protein
VLVVQRGTVVIYKIPFCSGKGLATATVVTDAMGTPFVLLRHGIGRDSVVTRDYLTVYQAVQPLIEMFHVPVAATVSPESGWEYTYEIGKPAAGGLALDLDLHVTGDDTGWAPAEKTRRIRLSVD